MSSGTNTNNNGAVSGGDVNALLEKSLSQSIAQLGNYQYKDGEPDTQKLFGLIEMDAGFANAINTLYTSFGHQISKVLSPVVYGTVLKYGKNIKISGAAIPEATLNRTAAGIALGVNLTAFLGPSISKFAGDVRGQHDRWQDFRRTLAPVLDDAYGKHSAGTLMSIPAETTGKKIGNTVIFAQRHRMHKEYSSTNMSTVLSAVGSNLINIAGEAVNLEALRTGQHRDVVVREHNRELDDRFRPEIEQQLEKTGRGYSEKYVDELVRKRIEKENSQGKLLGFALGSGLLKQFTDAMSKSSQRRLQHGREPYSAWEMIQTLQMELQNKPGKSGRFALPGRKGGELTLDRYITEIFKVNQREMARLNPNYTEIRDSLNADLEAIGKTIAERIEAGELNPLMLVRLVGEGQIVRNRGRGLASVDEVNTQIERFASRAHSFNVADPKEFIAQRNFTLEHVKECLKALEGEERIHFAATFPDPVLHSAGLKDEEIRQVQAQRAQTAYDHFLAAAVVAMDALGEDKLHDGGLGQTQIKKLHSDAEKVKAGGDKAVAGLKTSATNADGVEHIIDDFVVHHVISDRSYLGRLVAEGQQILQNTSAKYEGDAQRSHADKLRARQASSHHEDGTRDSERSHTSRLRAQHPSAEHRFE